MCDLNCAPSENCCSCIHYEPRSSESLYLLAKRCMEDYAEKSLPNGDFALQSDCMSLARKIFKKKHKVNKATLNGMKPIPSNFIKTQNDVDELFEIFKNLADAYSTCLQQ